VLDPVSGETEAEWGFLLPLNLTDTAVSIKFAGTLC
jgi:hypothetical protein